MFNFLKRRHIKNNENSSKPEVDISKNSNEYYNKEGCFALYLLFSDRPKFNIDEMIKRIKSTGSREASIENILENKDTEYSYGYAKIDGEDFELAGIDIPIPDEIGDYTIKYAYGKKEELEAMAEHKYHIIVFYRGHSTDYNLIYNAFAKLAYSFAEDNFVGMANIYAWNVVTPSLIKGLFEDKRLTEFASTPAMMIWRNFVKMPYDDKVWFVTKGNNVYGVHEYAYKGDSLEDSQMVYDMFEDIFDYEYTKKPAIQAGHTIQIGDDVYLKFRELYEIEDDLQGEGIGTLVLEVISKDEINK